MITSHAALILLVTGLITASVALQFVLPGLMPRLFGGEPATDAIGRIFARHWGLLVGCIGALLIAAAYQPALRAPVLLVATVEKVALAAMVFGSPLRGRALAVPIAAGDLAMSVLYVALLLGL